MAEVKSSRGGRYKLTVSIDPKYRKLLESELRQTRRSYSSVVEKALEAYFSPEKEEERLSIINKRLLTLDRSFNRVYDSTKIINEILCIFIKSWLLNNPELSQQQRSEQYPQVLRRYNNMLNNVIKSIMNNQSTFDLLPGIEKTLKESDFAQTHPKQEKEQGS